MTHAQADDFEAAKAIFEQLKDFPVERQERVLRWVAEGLGLTIGAAAPTPVPQSQAAPLATSAPSVGAPPAPSGTGLDIKSFVGSKSPKSDNQFAAAVAYYYRFEAPPAQRRESIDSDALQEATRLAGRPRLANPRATLNNAKAAGYLDGVTRGEFTINTVGENLVAMTLPGGTEGATRGPIVKKKGARPIKKSRKA